MTTSSRAKRMLGIVELLRFYWRVVLRPHRAWATVIFALMVGGSLFEMVTVGLAMPLLDVLMNPAHAQGNQAVKFLIEGLKPFGISVDSSALVFVLLVVACGLFFLHSVLNFLQACVTSGLAIKLREKVKLALVERFLAASFEEFSQRARGTIVHHINDPSESIYSAMSTLGTSTELDANSCSMS